MWRVRARRCACRAHHPRRHHHERAGRHDPPRRRRARAGHEYHPGRRRPRGSTQPSPDDARALAEADIVFYNAHGLEEWLADLLRNAARPGQPQVAVSEGLPALGANDEFREGNPHFLMSAALGRALP